MFASLIRRNATARVAESMKNLLPKELPPALSPQRGNLYQVLSRTASGGVGMKVHQTRWTGKKIEGSYWVVTRSALKCEGTHGKAWGQLYWKGKQVSPVEERIRGALKYTWMEGTS